VQAHALAARRLGLEPHIFSVERGRTAPEESEFGVLHRVRTPIRPLRAHMAQVHSPFIARAISDFLGPRRNPRPGPPAALPGRVAAHVIHGFGAWSLGGVLATRTLARRGVRSTPIASAYTTLRHESSGKLAGVRARMGRAALEYPVSDVWVRVIGARAEGYAYRRSRLILVNYDSVRDLLREEHGADLPVERIPYASALAFQASSEREAATSAAEADRSPDADADIRTAALDRLTGLDGPLIVSISRHDPRKGVDVLLRALAGLAREQVPFRACLIGPGPLLSANRAYASRLGLGSRVTIPGRVEEVMPYLRAADMFVLPSLEEGSGSVSLLEALQAGLPVVASRLDGIPEDLHEGMDALLVDPGDAGALQDALARLLRDADARAALAKRSRDLYETRFSPAALTAALGDVYARVGISS
jgi:glycosyltransferase involved in cell wall biosynthesis